MATAEPRHALELLRISASGRGSGQSCQRVEPRDQVSEQWRTGGKPSRELAKGAFDGYLLRWSSCKRPRLFAVARPNPAIRPAKATFPGSDGRAATRST